MLDFDLARIYGYTTKRFNEQVQRNIDKFPDRYRFQLTADELTICSRSHFATLKKSNNMRGTNYKYLPYAFTEQGIYMLNNI